MSDVFISYSRKDGDFVRQLSDDLKAHQREAWVDWQGIDYSTHWWEEICAGIDGADNFVILLSMNSLNSRYCHQEIEHARKQSKRIIPVLYEPIDEVRLVGGWYTNPDIHPIEALARENWETLKQIQFIDRSKLDGNQLVEALLHTVDTDVERVQIHTRLLLRIQDWEKRGRTPSALLRGDELLSHEAWRDKSLAAGDEPKPTQAQIDYVAESRRVEDADRAEQAAQLQKLNDATARAQQSAEEATIQQRRASQRTQIALGVIALAVVVGILAATLIANAQQQTVQANQNADYSQHTVIAANATLTPIPQTLAAGATQIANARLLINAFGNSLNQPDQQIAAVSTSIANHLSFDLSYRLRGLLYSASNNNGNALRDFNEDIALHPNDSVAYNDRGSIYLKQRQFSLALADFSTAIALDPNSAQSYNNRGVVYKDEQDYPNALTDFTAALTRDPQFADAYFNRGLVYYFAYNGQKDDLAIKDYTQAIQLNPNDEEAYYNRGVAYLGKQNYQPALADFKQAITLNPQDGQAYADLAYIEYKQEKLYGQAITDYTQAIALSSADFHAYGNRGLVYLMQNQFVLAIADFTQAINLNPQFALGYYYRGLAYRQWSANNGIKNVLADFLEYKQLSGKTDADTEIATLEALLTATGVPSATITPTAS